MPVQARCHCGDTVITLPRVPTKAGRCNCTFCQRTGAVWAYYGVDDFTIDRDDSRGDYGTDPSVGLHHFCTRCGMHTWGETVDWSDKAGDDAQDPPAGDGSPRYTKRQVNLNLVDDLDWSGVEIEQMDGRHQW